MATVLPSGKFETPPPPLAILPLPSESDSLEVLTVKLSSLLYVAHTGRCIATATGNAACAPEQSATRTKAEARAEKEMRPYEKMSFDHWKKYPLWQPPAIDWEKDRGHVPSEGRPLKKAQRCAEAMNRIWKTDRAQPDHYIWFTEHHPYHVSLITAVSRVIGAERDLGQTGLIVEKSESQVTALQNIIRTARQIAGRAGESATKQRILQQIKALETVYSGLWEKHSTREQTLGKRKHWELLESEAIEYAIPNSWTNMRLAMEASRR